jgi:hypothetical protein
MGRIGCPETSEKSQWSAGLIYTAEEAWNYVRSGNYKYKSMVTVVKMMKTCSRLKFTDIIIIIIIIYNVCICMYSKASYRSFWYRSINPIYLVLCVLRRKLIKTESTFIMTITGNQYTTQENVEIFHVKGIGL